jgi:hypothetical protein
MRKSPDPPRPTFPPPPRGRSDVLSLVGTGGTFTFFGLALLVLGVTRSDSGEMTMGLIFMLVGLGQSPGAFLSGRLLLRPPLQVQLPLRLRTVSKTEVDQRLVGDPGFLGQPLQVLHRRLIQAGGHALLQAPCVRILLRRREIVFTPHGSPQCTRIGSPPSLNVLGPLRAARPDSSGAVVLPRCAYQRARPLVP